MVGLWAGRPRQRQCGRLVTSHLAGGWLTIARRRSVDYRRPVSGVARQPQILGGDFGCIAADLIGQNPRRTTGHGPSQRAVAGI